MKALPRSRSAALALVLGLHVGTGLLLVQPRWIPLPSVARTEVRLMREAPRPPEAAATPRVNPASPPLMRAPVPEFQVVAPAPPSLVTLPPSPPTALPSHTAPAAPAPLNLNLPPPEARTRPPALAEQMRHDPRANTPMPSAEQRLADALGAKGWTVIDLGDGGKKITGPFGECSIVRPSMVDGIHDHPHAGMLTNRVFPCGGIEKGSKVAARPHERKR